MKTYLRNAVVEALAAGDDQAAGQLMDLVLGRHSQTQEAELRVLPAEEPLALAPASGIKTQWDWVDIIENRFLPTVDQSFTSSELYSWIARSGQLSGEEEAQARATFKRPKWKNAVGNSLGVLVHRKVIRNTGFNGKTYFVTPQPAVLAPAL